MNNLSHDFVTVDMRGLKASLVQRSRALQVSVSVLVRGAVERELGLATPRQVTRSDDAEPRTPTATVKLSIRMSSADAAALGSAALRAGLSRGAYIGALLSGAGACCAGSASRAECVAALVASSAELSTLHRNVHHLTQLLRVGNVRAAQEYRQSLSTLGDDVRRHLSQASGLLADLRPRRPAGGPPV